MVFRMTLYTADRKARGLSFTKEASMAKRFASDEVQRIVIAREFMQD